MNAVIIMPKRGVSHCLKKDLGDYLLYQDWLKNGGGG